MNHTIVLNNGTPVEVRNSKRARRMRLAIYGNGTVLAVKPYHVSFDRFKEVLEEKTGWIESKLKLYQGRDSVMATTHEGALLDKLCREAKDIAESRVAYFNKHYGFAYKNITIRNQKTRWGSCSSKKNLNFNYRIALLPPVLQDYLVVHELCHLKEFNHSKSFWDLVGEQIPNHRELRKKLR
jgi:predicted metal-dependent hydrolase